MRPRGPQLSSDFGGVGDIDMQGVALRSRALHLNKQSMEEVANDSLPPLPEKTIIAQTDRDSSSSKKRKFRVLRSYLDSTTSSVAKEVLEPIKQDLHHKTPPPISSTIDVDSKGKVRTQSRILASRIFNRNQDPSLPIPGTAEEDLLFLPAAGRGHSKTKSFFEVGSNTLIGRKSFYGPRFDKKGEVIPRSIAGNPEVFQRVRNYRTFSMGLKPEADNRTSPVPRLPVPQRLASGTSNFSQRAATQKPQQSRYKGGSVNDTRGGISSAMGDIQPTSRDTAKDLSTARTAQKRSMNRTIPLSEENFARLVQEIKERTLSQHMEMSPPLGSGGSRGGSNPFFPSHRGGSLTGEKIKAGRDQRAMVNYERMNRFWSYQNAKLSEKVRREANDTILVKSEDYREKLESLETMEKATPCELTYGNNMWYASLRNSGLDGDGSRAIPMGGNPTSGLFIRIKESANQSTDVIRRPQKKNLSLFNFYKNPYLQKKLAHEADKIAEIKPGCEEALELEVVGTSKLVSELEYAANIEGEKQLYLDHVVNDEGEGEPDFEEEIVDFHQDVIAKY